MEAYWEQAELRASGGVAYGEDETLLLTATEVSVYHGAAKVHRRGVALLTTHRLVWLDSALKPATRLALGLAHVRETSYKRGFLGMSSPKLVVALRERLPPGAARPVPCPEPGYMMFSFHGKGRDTFLAELDGALAARAWEQRAADPAAPQGAARPRPKQQFSTSGAGIQGIIRGVNTRQAGNRAEVSEAFSDLRALMAKAKDMVTLAERMAATRDKQRGAASRSGSSSAAPSEASSTDESRRFDTVLLGMGLANPVSRRTAGKTFQVELARQLAEFVERPLSEQGGMMELAEIYCRYNRARGTELVSPNDVLAACEQMEGLGLPLRLRRFPSGVLVLQADSHSDVGASRLVLRVLRGEAPAAAAGPTAAAEGPGPPEPGADELRAVPPAASTGALEVSRALGVSVAVATNHLLAAEALGFLCRDETPDGLRFHANWFAVFEQLQAAPPAAAARAEEAAAVAQW